jgi:hypothetical protein
MRKLKTKYGLVNINDWGDVKRYQITIDPIYELPNNKRRIRGNIPQYIEPNNLKEWVLNSIEKKMEQILNKRPTAKHKPIDFIKHYYFDYMDKQAEIGAPLPTRSNWTKMKARYDKTYFRNYLIPFIKEYGIGWNDFNFRNMSILVDYMRGKGLSDRSIGIQKGSFNLMFREAIKYELMFDLPKYPKLHDAPKKHGIRLTAYARATDEMIMDLIKYCQENDTTWHRKLRLNWLWILVDTGIRPFSKSDFTFDDLITTGDGTLFWRKEKFGEYRAQGGTETKKALLNLRTMYLGQDFQPKHILSNPDGSKALTVDTYLREAVNSVWGKTTDIDGRKYTSYSIRKWHINKSMNDYGEPPVSLANRVGHRLETLLEYYLDPNNIKYSRPRGITDSIKERNRIISITA